MQSDLPLSLRLRSFDPEDVAALASIYQDAVRAFGPAHYTPAQVDAWASYPEEGDDFERRLMRGATLIG